jgi:uncharacterized coiled-coil protein SlyX
MEAEDNPLFIRMATMLRMQIEVTTEGINAMFSEASRLWMERMDESDDRINVLEARIAELESMLQEARIAVVESNNKFRVLEAQIASLQLTIGGSSSAQSSVYGSIFRGE